MVVTGKEEAVRVSHKVKDDLVRVGLVENIFKYSWVKSQN